MLGKRQSRKTQQRKKQWISSFVPKFLWLFLVFVASNFLYGQPVLTLSSAMGSPGGSVTVNLSVSSPVGSSPAALQWTAAYPTGSILSVSAVAGPAAIAAGKKLSCNAIPAAYACTLSAMNSTIIGNGIVASLTFNLSPSATTMVISLTGTYGATGAGTSQGVSSSSGTITVVSGQALLSSLVCSPGTIAGGDSSVCSITLSRPAPAGGVVVATSSSLA